MNKDDSVAGISVRVTKAPVRQKTSLKAKWDYITGKQLVSHSTSRHKCSVCHVFVVLQKVFSCPQGHLWRGEENIWMVTGLGPVAPQGRTSLADLDYKSAKYHQETEKGFLILQRKQVQDLMMLSNWLLQACNYINNVHPHQKQSPVPQSGGLLLPSLLILLSLALLCTPLIHVLSR